MNFIAGMDVFFYVCVCVFLKTDRCRNTFIFPFLGESLTPSYCWLFSCVISAPNLVSAIEHNQRVGSHNEGKKATLKSCVAVLLHLRVAFSYLLSMYVVNFLRWCLRFRVNLHAGQWADIRVVYGV